MLNAISTTTIQMSKPTEVADFGGLYAKNEKFVLTPII
jgi:hypothetical protein